MLHCTFQVAAKTLDMQAKIVLDTLVTMFSQYCEEPFVSVIVLLLSGLRYFLCLCAIE